MKKPAKTALIRARCNPALKSDIAQVAMLKQLDEADIIRIACSVFVQQFKNPTPIMATNLTHA